MVTKERKTKEHPRSYETTGSCLYMCTLGQLHSFSVVKPEFSDQITLKQHRTKQNHMIRVKFWFLEWELNNKIWELSSLGVLHYDVHCEPEYIKVIVITAIIAFRSRSIRQSVKQNSYNRLSLTSSTSHQLNLTPFSYWPGTKAKTSNCSTDTRSQYTVNKNISRISRYIKRCDPTS